MNRVDADIPTTGLRPYIAELAKRHLQTGRSAVHRKVGKVAEISPRGVPGLGLAGCPRVAASGQQKNFHCRGCIKVPHGCRCPIRITDIGGGKV